MDGTEHTMDEGILEKVRQRAYALWEQEGRPEGRESEVWHKAEQEIRADGEDKSAPPEA